LNKPFQSPFTELDTQFMQQALALAGRGRFTVWPNPRVGCVIVQSSPEEKTPRVIGAGYHQRKGEPHAERNALAACVENPRGATLYVTLEPCCHHGSTPPCTEAILEAGIRRVVVAIQDPFPAVQGKGIEILRQHGILVDVGLLEGQAWYENRFFFHLHSHHRPWVILKTAVTLDGKCATATGHSKWITGEEARAHVHLVRAEADAILAGIQTVLSDNPTLTARPQGLGAHEFIPPVRIILDTHLRIPLDCTLIQTREQAPVWIFCGPQAPIEMRHALQNLGIPTLQVNQTGGYLHPGEILATLAERSISSLFLEGGPTIHTTFLEAGLVNEVLVYIAPILAGGKASPSFYMGTGVATMNTAPRLSRVERLSLGADTLIRGILKT
jgi:diaminohydroxyphosphoribosylaminopyrimidine deaminase/5-amino-6-(5-phosphoribosylamino)uracil reductase